MITRFQGDTHPIEFTLTKSKELVDLDLVSVVELAFLKGGSIITKTAVKDPDNLSGVVRVTFSSTDVDTAGRFPYDISIDWLDGSESTVIKSTLTLNSVVHSV